MRRMQQLAGLDADAKPESKYSNGAVKAGYIEKSRNGERDEVLRTRIVREPLPKPDYDDSGLN